MELDAAEIARLIANGDPPDGFVQAVENLRATLRWTLAREPEYPTRVELREKLEAMAHAIELVCGNIADFTISTLLRSGDNDFLNRYEMCLGLGDLAARVKKHLEAISAISGPNKYYLRSDGLSSQVICAMMVCHAWNWAHGKWPPNNNNTAHKACDALWCAADGTMPWLELRRKGTASLVVWRDHIRDAKKSLDAPEGRHIERFRPAPGE